MTNYSALLAQKAALEKQAADLDRQLHDARKAERSGVIAQIKTLLSEHGLTVDDLGTKSGATKAKGGANAGKKVAAKYRNAATGESWTGRGLKPKWIQAAIAAGKKLEDFAV